MNGYHVGNLIKQERQKRKITQKQLAMGIFTPQMLSKFEKNMCELDILQLDILLQRLGRSPDKLEIFMTMSEYEKIEERDAIESFILQNRMDEADKYLEHYIGSYGEDNNVHYMYYNRMKAYMFMQIGNSSNKAFEYIKKALDCTLGGWNERPLDELLISTYEMENLLVYGKLLFEMGYIDIAQSHIEECRKYIESHYMDTEEFAKIYPKCAWLLSLVFSEPTDDKKIIECCERALDILRREAIGYFAIPVIEQLLSRCVRGGREDLVEFWTNIYSTLKSIYDEYVPDMCHDSLLFYVYQREYHLDFETIKRERLAKGYTQEKLIDGIFNTAKPLSLIESHKKEASKAHYEDIMKKIGFDKRRYNGLLATESFDVLQKRNVFDYLCCAGKYDEAESVLDELEEMLDMTISENVRFIEINRMDIDLYMNNMSADKLLERSKKLLLETYNIEIDNNRTMTRNEANMVAFIVNAYREMKKLEEPTRILRRVINNYDNSRVNPKYHLRSYLLLSSNYARTLYDSGNRDEAMNLANRLMKKELRWAKTRAIPVYCIILACGNMADTNMTIVSKRFLKATYYMYIFNYEEKGANVIAKYYKDVYNEEIV